MKKKHKIIIGLLVAYFIFGGWVMFVPHGTYNEYVHLKELLKAMYFVEEKETWAYKNGHRPPPLPNYFENRKTRLGIDSDKNGIRDDIDFIIHRRATSHNHFYLQNQIARAEIEFLILNGYYDPNFRGGDKWMRSIECNIKIDKEKKFRFENGLFAHLVQNTNNRYGYKKEKYFDRGNSFSIAPNRDITKIVEICDFIVK